MTDPPKLTLADGLAKLVGRRMSSVTFVMDYVQLAFDGHGLNAYTLPTITHGSERNAWGQLGYRDALCAPIGLIVESASADEHQVSITFEGGATISISLRKDDYRGPEALELHLNDGQWWVV
jgi:hypothetical protein